MCSAHVSHSRFLAGEADLNHSCILMKETLNGMFENPILQNKVGIPIVSTARSAATISALGVLWLTAVCFLKILNCEKQRIWAATHAEENTTGVVTCALASGEVRVRVEMNTDVRLVVAIPTHIAKVKRTVNVAHQAAQHFVTVLLPPRDKTGEACRSGARGLSGT
jgi:hypothetical protein